MGLPETVRTELVWPSIRVAGLVLAALLAGLPTVPLYGGTGAVETLPRPRAKAKHGLRLKVDSRWVAGTGYRPVRLTLSTAPPLPSGRDRVLRVEITASSWGTTTFGSPRVVQRIELPQGSTVAAHVIRLPQAGPLHHFRLAVYEGNRKLDELSTHIYLNANARMHSWSEATPGILFIDRDAPSPDDRQRLLGMAKVGNTTPLSNRFQLPDIRGLVATLPSEEFETGAVHVNQRRLDDETTLGLLENLPKVELLPPGELPDRWIDFSGFQFIVISLPDLVAIQTTRPRQFTALRRWAALGPTLCVYDVGADFERLAELERLLDLAPAEPAQGPRKSLWSEPAARDFGSQVTSSLRTGGVRMIGERRVLLNSRQDAGAEPDSLLEFAKAPPDEPPFRIRELGLGRVVAFAAEDPFPGSAQKWCWMLNTVGERNFKWYKQFGMSLHRENTEYWNWLIPGVGRAPVVTFLVLITLFAVAIGPVNYFVLRRLRRLYLMLITVPLGATLVTVALLGYALITDGLGTKTRIRSVALLDQASGETVSWSRQTYYASIAPSRGLVFPLESLVIPLPSATEQQRSQGDNGPTRRLVWSDRQALERGYLPSRVTSQFVVAHAGPSDAELVVSEPPRAGPPGVENLLGVPIEQLVLRDARGDLYHASDLAEGGKATPQPATPEELAETLGKLYDDRRPQPPQNFNSAAYGNAFVFDMFGYRNRWNLDTNEDPPGFHNSLLERGMRRYLKSPGDLPARTYVAVTAANPLVPRGVRGAREVAGLHVIIGSWNAATP